MLIAGAIVLGALLLFRLNLYEYQPAGGSGPGGAPPLLRINRLTGHAEPFVNGRWIGSVARPLPAADPSTTGAGGPSPAWSSVSPSTWPGPFPTKRRGPAPSRRPSSCLPCRRRCSP